MVHPGYTHPTGMEIPVEHANTYIARLGAWKKSPGPNMNPDYRARQHHKGQGDLLGAAQH